MDTWWKLPGAMLAASTVLAGCVNESVRRHDQAMQAVREGDRVAKERRVVAPQTSTVAEKSYTQPDHRWSVSYPGDWTLEDSSRFVTLRRGQAVLGIHTLPPVAGRSLDEVADAAIQVWEREMQKVNVVRRVSRQRVTLAGDVTAIAVVHHIGTGRVGQSRKIVTVVRDRSFLIDAETQLAAWPDNERDFNQIIGSFRVVQ